MISCGSGFENAQGCYDGKSPERCAQREFCLQLSSRVYGLCAFGNPYAGLWNIVRVGGRSHSISSS